MQNLQCRSPPSELGYGLDDERKGQMEAGWNGLRGIQGERGDGLVVVAAGFWPASRGARVREGEMEAGERQSGCGMVLAMGTADVEVG